MPHYRLRCVILVSGAFFACLIIYRIANFYRLRGAYSEWAVQKTGRSFITTAINNSTNKGKGTNSKECECDEILPPVEKHHVVFVKVHKAASTTVQNILLRFAMSHKLNVLLSSYVHLNETGAQINRNNLFAHPQGMKFDILCNHIIYNRSEIAPYFPKDTFYFGIVREPFQQFRSAFMYYVEKWRYEDLMKIVKRYPQNPIQAFLQNLSELSPLLRHPQKAMINNRMSIDFGISVQDFENAKRDKDKIENFVVQIHEEIPLILISEMFDESIILLRRYLNWPIKDMLYLHRNSLKQSTSDSRSSGATFSQNFTREDLEAFRRWAAFDIALYNSSVNLFQKKIKAQPKFEEELEAFRRIKDLVVPFCQSFKTKGISSDILSIASNEWTESFQVTREGCDLMDMSEIQIVKHAQEIQTERLSKLLNN